MYHIIDPIYLLEDDNTQISLHSFAIFLFSSMSKKSHAHNSMVYFHNEGLGAKDEINTHDWKMNSLATILKQHNDIQVDNINILLTQFKHNHLSSP